MDVMFWRVKFLMRACSSVLLPTLGGPTMATTIGGGSTGVRSTSGMCCFFVSRSCARWKRFWALSTDWTAKAFGLRCLASCSWTCGFFAFFFSALRPFHPKNFLKKLIQRPINTSGFLTYRLYARDAISSCLRWRPPWSRVSQRRAWENKKRKRRSTQDTKQRPPSK